jgi:hypothetical protein
MVHHLLTHLAGAVVGTESEGLRLEIVGTERFERCADLTME